MGRRVAIVAGEASGDLLGAALVRAVRERFPDTEFYGIAGPRMISAGARTVVPMEKLSVRGYVEAMRSLPELLRIRSSLASQLVGTGLGIAIALSGGLLIYGALKATLGLRLDAEEEFNGADLTIHKITSSPERETLW